MIAELIEKRQRLHHENVAILQKSKADGRDVLNPDEEGEWQSRDAAIEALTKQIERYKKQEQIEKALGAPEERKTAPNPIEIRNSDIGRQQLRQGARDFEDALRGWFLTPTEKGATEAQRSAAQRVGINLSHKALELNLSTRALRSVRPEEIRQWESRAQTLTGAGGGFTIAH